MEPVVAFSETLSAARSRRGDPVRLTVIVALGAGFVLVGLAAIAGVGGQGAGWSAAWIGACVALAIGFGVQLTRWWQGRSARAAGAKASGAFEQLVEHLPLVVYVDSLTDNSANLYTSPQVEDLLGYAADEWMSDPDLFVKVLHPDDRDWVLRLVRETNESGIPFASEYRLVHRDGRVVWVLDESAHICRDDGTPVAAQGFLLDITRRREAEEQLRKLAWTDALTGLANRTHLLIALERALAETGTASLVFLDLDDFKTVNDSLGHSVGDDLLASIAGRLRAAVRPDDLVARLGGDEFAILPAEGDAREIAERALAAVNQSGGLLGYDVRPTASAGIATGRDVETILRDADLAMYAAKEAGQGFVTEFAPDMARSARARLTLAADLRHEALLEQLELVYQPTFELGTGRIEAVEALLRWRHPSRGLLAPAEFIEHAEHSGAINQIGRWVLETALAQVSTWRADSADDLRVAVNLSTVQLRDPGLVAEIAALLERHELGAQALRLELTESAVLQADDDSKAVLRSLARLGVSLALDDFGKGHTSVAQLADVPFSVLKIDRSFLDHPSPGDSLLLRGIVALADEMGLTTVTEGIERDDQLAAVRRLGCAIGQGFFLARPAPAAEVTRLLVEDRRRRRAAA